MPYSLFRLSFQRFPPLWTAEWVEENAEIWIWWESSVGFPRFRWRIQTELYEFRFVKLVQTLKEELNWIISEIAAKKHLKQVYKVGNKVKARNVLYSRLIDLAKSWKSVILEEQLMKSTIQWRSKLASPHWRLTIHEFWESQELALMEASWDITFKSSSVYGYLSAFFCIGQCV